jgi:xylan 1,4-beta-xylosidase
MAVDESKKATIRVDAGQWLGELPHNWNYIGYDEINYTYTPEGQELLAKFGALQEKPYYVRAHHLLCTGNGHGFYKWGSTNAYLEDEAGQPVYNWTLVDLILDTTLKHGCKPFVEIGFMPQDLADTQRYDPAQDNYRLQNYQAYGWACPPKDYQKWYDLVFHLVRHCAERYGAQEIQSWYWELWNEPDLDYYWKGSVEEFNKLYDYTAAAVKAACPQARVGGPGTTNPVEGRRSIEFLDKFLDHCANGVNHHSGQTGAPVDFLSFHVKGGGYRTDPKHRRQAPPSVQRILSHTQNGHKIISQYPSLKNLECVLSEIDPDGWAAGGAWDNINLNFRNTEYYPSFVAAAFDKVSRYARRHTWDLRLLSWAFMFVGERCFEGTRAFSTQGIDKAILNLFRMYAQMGHQEVYFQSSHAKDPLAYADPNGRGEGPDISGFATLSGNKSLETLIYNHHDEWELDAPHTIELEVENLPFANGSLVVKHYRIDQSHSNAYAEWVRQGRPMYPAPGQRAAIKAREGLELLEPPQRILPRDGKVKLSFQLPVHAVSLLVIAPTQAR